MGVVAFWILIRNMRCAGVESPPELPYFILFATMRGWLLVVHTARSWKRSRKASLGVFYLILVAPFDRGYDVAIASQRALSVFHSCAFIGSAGYTCLMFVRLVIV
jgi:hypothetical protein